MCQVPFKATTVKHNDLINLCSAGPQYLAHASLCLLKSEHSCSISVITFILCLNRFISAVTKMKKSQYMNECHSFHYASVRQHRNCSTVNLWCPLDSVLPVQSINIRKRISYTWPSSGLLYPVVLWLHDDILKNTLHPNHWHTAKIPYGTTAQKTTIYTNITIKT